MAPNGETIRCSRARVTTPGWRTNSAPRSWKAIVLGSSAKTSAPKPIGANLRRRGLRKTDMSPLTPTQQLTGACTRIGGLRRVFYGLINLAKVLTAARGRVRESQVPRGLHESRGVLAAAIGNNC